MIKAKVVSLVLSESVGGISKLDLETYLEDQVSQNSFYEAIPWKGLNIIIMTEEDYEDEMSKKESLRKRLNEKEGEICKLIVNNDVEQGRLREEIQKLREENKGIKKASDTLRNSLLDEREKTRKLEEENEAIQKDIKDLEEKLAQEAAEIDIHPDGTIVFRNKRVSELEKEVEKLKEENKALKEDKITMKITGGLFYKED
jgi:uncharacterized protein (DUF3084 family)